MTKNFTELAFSSEVRAMQEVFGTRDVYADYEKRAPDKNVFTAKEREFIAERDGFYVASVGEGGWPYVQFRGGPTGFLKVLDEHTLAFADYKGNGQYISAGNYRATGKAHLVLMDYANRKRLKIWASAEVIAASEDEDLAAAVDMPGYGATVELSLIHI